MDRLMKSDVKYRFVIDIENSLKEWHLNVFSWRPIKWGAFYGLQRNHQFLQVCLLKGLIECRWIKYFGRDDNITWNLILKQHHICTYALYIVNYCNIVSTLKFSKHRMLGVTIL
jgi:hypothetical protein